MVSIVRNLLIVLACLCSPIYGLWLACGAVADHLERQRVSARRRL